MINKVLQILTAAGISLFLWCVVYMIYVSAAEWAVVRIELSGSKTMLAVAGFVAIAEGVVVHTDAEHTVIQYYHEWDGTDYNHVIYHKNADYSESTKVPVAYSVGMCMGECLVVGYYRKRILFLGIIGLGISGLGFMIRLIRKGIGTWQEERL